MAAQLASTVYVRDPDTRQTVRLDEGTSPEPRLAVLVTNPAAWVDGKLPRLPKAQAAGPSEGGQDGASGDASAEPSGDADTTSSEDDKPAAPAAKKTAAKKTASAPARGRTTAAEGTGGQ